MPTLSYNHGITTLLLTSQRVRRRRDGLDTGDFEFDSSSEEEAVLTPGLSVPVARYQGLVIMDAEAECDGDAFTHRVSAIGVAGAKSERMIAQRTQPALEGFDNGTEVWLTRNPDYLFTGRRMTGYGLMVCTSVDRETLEVPGWYRLTGSFEGMLGGSKAVTRTISNNAEVIQRDQLINRLSGGWSTPQRSQFFWPHVTVTFDYVTSYIPIKTLPEQGGTAPGDLFPVVEISTGVFTDATYHWPNGWRRVSFNVNPIAETTICRTQEVWEYQQKITP